MITVMLIWLYVIITTYLVGYSFLKMMSSWPGMATLKNGIVKKYKTHFRESYIVTGIVVVTVFSEIFSIFQGVGLKANIILILYCVVSAVYYREELLEDLQDMHHVLSSNLDGIFYILIFLLMAYGTSHGIMHYDSDLYHAQAIHWIEDYGIVKGLGNLHVRLAYNSASFALSALYSMAFFGGQSYHVMAGFFALLLAWQCLDIKNVVRRGHIVLSDFARVAAIYYLFTIYDEMVAPASDYFLQTMVFYTIIHWLDMYVRHEKSYVPYIQLTMLGVYAVTIKLSAAPMVLLAIIPIYMLFHDRTKEKMKAFGISILLVLFIVLPFLTRNVIISGWVLYPVTILDFFGFDWEIPKGVAEFDALEIKTFGRGYNDVTNYGHVTMKEWVPHWFSSLSMMNKAMVVLALVAIVIYIVCFLYFLLAASERKTHKLNNKVFEISHRSMLNLADFLTIGATLIGCMIFWFMSAPLIRYGIVYVWLVVAVIFGRMFILLSNRVDKKAKDYMLKVFVALLALWIVFKGINLIRDEYPRFNAKYFLAQQDYGTYETKTFEISGVTFYYPAEGDQIGYEPFPAATHDLSDEMEFIGKNIHDGFKPKGR